MYIMEKDNAVRYVSGLKEKNKLIDLGYTEVTDDKTVKTSASGKAKKAVRDEADGN